MLWMVSLITCARHDVGSYKTKPSWSKVCTQKTVGVCLSVCALDNVHHTVAVWKVLQTYSATALRGFLSLSPAWGSFPDPLHFLFTSTTALYKVKAKKSKWKENHGPYISCVTWIQRKNSQLRKSQSIMWWKIEKMIWTCGGKLFHKQWDLESSFVKPSSLLICFGVWTRRLWVGQ